MNPAVISVIVPNVALLLLSTCLTLAFAYHRYSWTEKTLQTSLLFFGGLPGVAGACFGVWQYIQTHEPSLTTGASVLLAMSAYLLSSTTQRHMRGKQF